MPDKPKHTPGPWSLTPGMNKRRINAYDKAETNESVFFIKSPRSLPGDYVALVMTYVTDVEPLPPEVLENAKLIAAAPLLLESLQRVAGLLAHVADGDDDCRAALEEAADAVLKAGG